MADDETDGINETLTGSLHIGLTVAGRFAENAARDREQAARDAQAHSEQARRELQARLDAERAVARATFAPVHDGDWWQHASAEDISRTWEAAATWREIDPDADRAFAVMREQLRERFGVDVDELRADPAAVRAAVDTRSTADEQRSGASAETVEAAALLGDAEHADRLGRPAEGDELDAGAAGRYDTAERRLDLAASLEDVADEETIEARILADTHEAQPPQAALASSSTAPARPRAQRGIPLTRVRPPESGR